VLSPNCEPEKCKGEIEEESENDTWSTRSSINTDSSGRFGGSEKNSHIDRRHAPNEFYKACNDHRLRGYSREYNDTLRQDELQGGHTHCSESWLFWSFLHVSSINYYMCYAISCLTQKLLCKEYTQPAKLVFYLLSF